MLLPRIGTAERVSQRHQRRGNVPMPEVRDGRAGRGTPLGRMKGVHWGVIMLTTSLIAACGNGGSWVEVPVGGFSPAELEELKKDPNGMKSFVDDYARPVCTMAGKAYAGEVRFENGGAQAKCK